MKIMAFGKNWSGELLFKPVDEEQFFSTLKAALPRNVATLQRAGADFVMSYASLGSNVIMNLIDKSSVLMVAEGLDVFRVRIPDELVGVRIVLWFVRDGQTHHRGGSARVRPWRSLWLRRRLSGGLQGFQWLAIS